MKLDQVKLREPVVDQVRLVGVGSECEAAGEVWTMDDWIPWQYYYPPTACFQVLCTSLCSDSVVQL